MLRRSASKKTDPKQQYYMVVAIFCGVCVLSVLYVLLNPKPKLTELQVLDDSNIMVHNGQGH
jgi:hypothetical protein